MGRKGGGKDDWEGREGARGEKVTNTPISGMVSGKYFWKNSMTSSPVVIFSNSSKGMKRVQVNVLSWIRKTNTVHGYVSSHVHCDTLLVKLNQVLFMYTKAQHYKMIYKIQPFTTHSTVYNFDGLLVLWKVFVIKLLSFWSFVVMFKKDTLS